MSTSGMVPAPGGEPVSRAEQDLAHDIHIAMLRDLGRPYDEIEGRFDTEAQRQKYPYILFGELAMYIAGVKLEEDASEPDRARGVIESLRRIAVTPGLLEAVTNAPFSAELAGKLSAELPQTMERDEEEAADAENLRAAIRKAGYLEHSMIPNGRPIQLKYHVDSDAKPPSRLISRPVPGSIITLKLAPTNSLEWDIDQYRGYGEYSGYYGYLGTRHFVLDSMFSLVVANSADALPSKLTKAVGRSVRIGKVSAGTRFNIAYNFGPYTKEVKGSEHDFSKTKVEFPAKLEQAYLGDTTDYPLFHESYM